MKKFLMPYVRTRGNQLAIVHGEREPGSGKVKGYSGSRAGKSVVVFDCKKRKRDESRPYVSSGHGFPAEMFG
jgi:hypothetical protein